MPRCPPYEWNGGTICTPPSFGTGPTFTTVAP